MPPRVSGAASRRAGASGASSGGSYRFLKEETSSHGKGRALLIGGAIVVAVAVVLLLSLGGGSHKSPSTGTSAVTTSTGPARHTSAARSVPKVNPGVVSISVLNGTQTNGLAHRIAAALKEKGYAHATALDGHPPGAYPKTIVEYATGHSTDAKSVAQVLDVSASEVQPMQSAMLPLISGATVAIIAGEDQPMPSSGSTQTPGTQNSGTSENGESGAGATG